MALEVIETTAQIINSSFLSSKNGQVTICFYWIWLYHYSQHVGGAIIVTHSNINVSLSFFDNNDAVYGGAIFAEQRSNISINASVFIRNKALFWILYSNINSIRIEASEFSNNNANYEGVLTAYSSKTTIQQSVFENNIRCVLYFDGSVVNINSCRFRNNSEDYNEVVKLSGNSNTTVEQSIFEGNTGTALSSVSSSVILKTTEFSENIGNTGVLSSYGCNVTSISYCMGSSATRRLLAL